MALYTNDLSTRNRAPAANRLPIPDPLLMDFATRRIASRYSVNLTHARLVAELVNASIVEARQ
jgi:hypothetical protein